MNQHIRNTHKNLNDFSCITKNRFLLKNPLLAIVDLCIKVKIPEDKSD